MLLSIVSFSTSQVNMTTVKLMNEMRVTEFNGASGRVAFGGFPKGAVGVENNRHIAPTLYRLNNLVGSWSQKFIQVCVELTNCSWFTCQFVLFD
jgi:hypothetical protein